MAIAVHLGFEMTTVSCLSITLSLKSILLMSLLFGFMFLLEFSIPNTKKRLKINIDAHRLTNTQVTEVFLTFLKIKNIIKWTKQLQKKETLVKLWGNKRIITHVNLAHNPVGPAGRQTFPTTSEKQSLLIWFPQRSEFKKTGWYLSWNCVLIKGDSCSPEMPFCELYFHKFPGPVYPPPSDLIQLKECSRWPGSQDQIIHQTKWCLVHNMFIFLWPTTRSSNVKQSF